MANQNAYRGWDIGYECKPIPSRVFDWTATSPDFDADCDQDGFFICSGAQVNAATREELIEEIDRWHEENAE